MPEIFANPPRPDIPLKTIKTNEQGRGKRKAEKGDKLPSAGAEICPSNCKYVYAKWLQALFNDLLSLLPHSPGQDMCLGLLSRVWPPEILQPVSTVFSFFLFQQFNRIPIQNALGLQ